MLRGHSGNAGWQVYRALHNELLGSNTVITHSVKGGLETHSHTAI